MKLNLISMMALASRTVRSIKGFRHIKGYDRQGVPPHERRYWRVRDRVIGIFHNVLKQEPGP